MIFPQAAQSKRAVFNNIGLRMVRTDFISLVNATRCVDGFVIILSGTFAHHTDMYIYIGKYDIRTKC